MTYQPDGRERRIARGSLARWADTFVQPSGGWVVQSEANRYDTVGQVVHSLHRYDVYGPDGTLERTSMLRLELAYLYPSDIRRLPTTTGFREITIKGGFEQPTKSATSNAVESRLGSSP